MSLFVKKPLAQLLAQAGEAEKGLKRTLGAANLVALGIGAIIGAGLFVDNEVGACTATGQGEDVIRVAGSHSVIELMRQGLSPEAACKKVIERIVKIKKDKVKEIQVAFLALNKKGQVGSFAIHPGFEYAIKNTTEEKLVKSKSWFNP